MSLITTNNPNKTKNVISTDPKVSVKDTIINIGKIPEDTPVKKGKKSNADNHR